MEKGIRVRVKPHTSERGKGLSYPAFAGTLLEYCNGEGWDVVDVQSDAGEVVSVYSFDVSAQRTKRYLAAAIEPADDKRPSIQVVDDGDYDSFSPSVLATYRGEEAPILTIQARGVWDAYRQYRDRFGFPKNTRAYFNTRRVSR